MKVLGCLLFIALLVFGYDKSGNNNLLFPVAKLKSPKNMSVSEPYTEGISDTVSQNLFGTDVVLSSLQDPYSLHLYGKIEFLIGGKKVLEYEEKYLEVEGFQDKVCSYFQQTVDGVLLSFYVFRYNNRPSPDRFLVFRQEESEVSFVGVTEGLTADIYGDVDLDGKFEIGGFNTYCEPGVGEEGQPGHPFFCIDHLRVYEIGNEFARDTVMENFIMGNKRMLLQTKE